VGYQRRATTYRIYLWSYPYTFLSTNWKGNTRQNDNYPADIFNYSYFYRNIFPFIKN